MILSQYQRLVSSFLKAEFSRLSSGNSETKKRHDRFVEYMNRIQQDPLNTDYMKHALDQYRAAPYKVGQYRIFFEIIDETVDFDLQNDKGSKVEGKFVHFVWMNNENCKHDSSKGEHDPCYREFKNLKNNGEIAVFQRPELPKGYVAGGILGKVPALYPKLFDTEGVAQAQAIVVLDDSQSAGFQCYKLEGIISNPDSSSREFELLQELMADAEKYGVKIEWEILRDSNFAKFQSHAIKLGMKVIDSDSVWEVYTN